MFGFGFSLGSGVLQQGSVTARLVDASLLTPPFHGRSGFCCAVLIKAPLVPLSSGKGLCGFLWSKGRTKFGVRLLFGLRRTSRLCMSRLQLSAKSIPNLHGGPSLRVVLRLPWSSCGLRGFWCDGGCGFSFLSCWTHACAGVPFMDHKAPGISGTSVPNVEGCRRRPGTHQLSSPFAQLAVCVCVG